jgi:hypothetical protein
MSRCAVFGYGSLVDPGSVEETLGRRPERSGPARLAGWRRRWSIARDNLAAEKTFARQGGDLPPWIVGLNLEHAGTGAEARGAPNGALIEVTEAELARLDIRELRYDRVEVTVDVSDDHGFETVYAYTARPQYFAPELPPGGVAMAPYLRALQTAFEDLGPGQWELFLETTGPPPVELIEPVLVKDLIPPGNPREW